MSDSELRQSNKALSDQERAEQPALCRALPVHLTVGNTHKCNLDCPMCFKEFEEGHNMSYPTMPLEMFRSIAAQTFPTAARVTLTVSGDPLVSETIVEELEIGGEHGVEFEVTTNGVMLRHGPMTDLLLEHCGTLTLSFDSATKETYEKIRKGSNFEKVLEAVRCFTKAKAELGRGPLMAAMAVLQRSNVRELPDWVRLMHSIGIEALGVDHIIVPKWSDAESCVHEKQLTNRMLAEAQLVADELGISLRLPLPFEIDEDAQTLNDEPAAESVALPKAVPPASSEEPTLAQSEPELPTERAPEPVAAEQPKLFVRCPYVWSESWIGFDGSVSPCCNAQYLEKMGNLGEQSFAEIWNGQKYRELRSSLVQGTPPPVCRNCHLAIREVETGETFVKSR